MRFLFPVISGLLAILLGAGPGWSLDVPSRILVTAATMHTDADGTVFAEGEVIVQGEGVTVRADTLRYDPETNILLLSGGVEMEEDSGRAFTGDSLTLDLEDLTGGIRRGEIIVVPNGFRVRGEDIRRLGPEEFSVSKGVFTSCPGECPDWSFTAREIQVRKEGYLVAKHAAFRIVGVPVFYTPYLYYPVKTKRQTGLLLPEIRFSEETGMESTWPFFITLGSHADVTLIPRIFSRDSLGLGAETRYRLDSAGGGDWSGFAIGGNDGNRWYFRGEHAMSLGGRFWLRGRWYDASAPLVQALFGQDFDDRYPGTVYRLASIQARSGALDLTLTTDSLLPDGAQSRVDASGDRIDRDRLSVHLGPAEAGPVGAGLSGESVRFSDESVRNLFVPTVRLNIRGPEGFSGSLTGEAVVATGEDGTVEDEALLVTLRERISVASEGKWGRHRIDLDVSLSDVQGAAFSSSLIRDGRDLVQDRELGAVTVRSRLVTGKVGWNLEVGGWRDGKLEFKRGFAETSLTYGGFFFVGTVNLDAEWGLVLPSLDGQTASPKGWSTQAGYESGGVGIALGRESTEDSPDLASGRLRIPVRGIWLTGEAFYDIEAGTMADETLSAEIPGRCWSLTLSRLRSPDRTDWKVSFDLGI